MTIDAIKLSSPSEAMNQALIVLGQSIDAGERRVEAIANTTIAVIFGIIPMLAIFIFSNSFLIKLKSTIKKVLSYLTKLAIHFSRQQRITIWV